MVSLDAGPARPRFAVGVNWLPEEVTGRLLEVLDELEALERQSAEGGGPRKAERNDRPEAEKDSWDKTLAFLKTLV